MSEDGTELVYFGGIDEEAFLALKQEYSIATKKHGKAPTLLRISSTGGDVEFGLKMGIWVVENNLDVKVDSTCLSSCANYVFTAGKRKFLSQNSVLGWHGSENYAEARFEGLLRVMERDKTADIFRAEKFGFKIFYENLLKEQPSLSSHDIKITFLKKLDRETRMFASFANETSEFYASLGIDPMLPNYGYNQIKADTSLHGKFFFYSLEELGQMGVDNINLIDSEWNPAIDDRFFKVKPKYIYLQPGVF